MLEDSHRESPLIGRTPRDGLAQLRIEAGVSLVEVPFEIHLNLRGDARDPAFRTVIEAVVEGTLPLVPNTFAVGGCGSVYWLAPDEWLIVAPSERQWIPGALQSALSGQHAALTSVGHGQTMLRVSGPGSRDLLARGCPLDLHPRVFGVGRCAQTRFAKAPVLMALIDTTPGFDIVVRRSFAEYLWDALVDFGSALK